MLFLYEWKSKFNAATAAPNNNAALGNGFANEHTIRRWHAKFETGDKSLTNVNRGRSETVVRTIKFYEQ